jgi:hypothetical protein
MQSCVISRRSFFAATAASAVLRYSRSPDAFFLLSLEPSRAPRCSQEFLRMARVQAQRLMRGISDG